MNHNWPQKMPIFEVYENLKPVGTYKNQFNIVDDKIIEVKEIVVYRFAVSDVEDPDLYAGEPLYKWQNSEMGKWVLAHAVETPIWHRIVDVTCYNYQYAIKAKLKAKDLTFFYLKWKDAIDKTIM